MRQYGEKQRNALLKVRIEDLKDNRQKILHILRFGSLAPSTHNTQPWSFKLEKDTVIVMPNFKKNIPEADPSGRDMYISIGAFIKNVEVASRQFNADLKIIDKIRSINNGEVVSELRFTKLDKAVNPKKTDKLEEITERQNYRGIFDKFDNEKYIKEIDRIICPSGVGVVYLTENNSLDAVAKLTAKGLKIAYSNKNFRSEISRHINHNLSRKMHGLHGFSLRMNLPISFVVPKLIRIKDMGGKLSKLNYESIISSSCALVLTASDNKSGWVKAGRYLEDVLLRTTSLGFSGSIYAAAIEMGDLRNELKRSLKIKKGLEPLLVVCVGKQMDKMPFSVRSDIKNKIVK
jgi:hypothetical protein